MKTRKDINACKCTEHGEKKCFEAKQERWIKAHDEMEIAKMKLKQSLKESDCPKHTPGPWTFIAEFGMTVGVPHKGAVAIIREANPNEGGGLDVDYETAKANGRLIAAAPELLQLIKDAVIQLPDNSGWVKHAKMLIAKAEGK